MMGTIFDIKEFALNDGDGIRTTVFFKGCPLRCVWCHNPEGLSPSPELYIKQNGCLGCGLCRRPCSHPECKPYGRCVHICPCDLVSIAGNRWDADELSEKLLRNAEILNASGGGITLSGGEPLMQADFAIELLKKLRGRVHVAIETSGFAPHDVFKNVATLCNFVIMDIKIADETAHKKHTGVSNKIIIENAKWLKSSGIPRLFRTPLIPGITDTTENLKAISEIVEDDRIELLSYNTLAPAKYKSVGRKFPDYIDAEAAKAPDLTIFKNATHRA